jgi:hypothetical protein
LLSRVIARFLLKVFGGRLAALPHFFVGQIHAQKERSYDQQPNSDDPPVSTWHCKSPRLVAEPHNTPLAEPCPLHHSHQLLSRRGEALLSQLDFGVITFISANKLAEKAGWDKATLAVELSALAPLLSKAELDVILTVEI